MSEASRSPSTVPSASAAPGTLRRIGDRIVFRRAGGQADIPARVVWARPLTALGREVSILAEEKKEELAFLPSLDVLDPGSQAVAREALSLGRLAPKIVRITQAGARYGNRYWDVETDRGPARFMTGSPETAVFEPLPGNLVVRDVLGNCFEIPDVAALDPASRIELDKVV